MVTKFSSGGGVGRIVANGIVKPFYNILSANSISFEATIGKNTMFYHRGLGCVVHGRTVIGDNCVIFQNVTMGSKWSDGHCEGEAPTIGDGVMIGAGAVILGDIRVGNDVIIGANAVVTEDVPDYHMAIGVPARILPRKQ